MPIVRRYCYLPAIGYCFKFGFVGQGSALDPLKGLLKIAVQALRQICRSGKFESPLRIPKTFK